MSSVQVIAVLRFQETELAQAREILNELVDETRKEEGCIEYSLFEDFQKPGTFVTLEVWDSMESIDLHNNSEHLRKFGAAAAPLKVTKTEVYRTKRIN